MSSKALADSVDIGTIVADTYEIVSVLGRGGMGTVWEAHHQRLPGKRVAIKVLHSSIAEDADALARFRREAEIACRLGHPNIVEVHDFNTLEDGTPYLVLELLEGQSLDAKLKEGALGLELCEQILRQVSSALQSAHEQGVIHRDLKPQNIFLVPSPSGVGPDIAKVLDFGISKIRGSQTVKTQESTLLGTPQYMAPEQATGQHHSVDARTDLFALAVMLYELLSGRAAFPGQNIPEVVYKVVHVEATPITEYLPEFPPEKAAALAKAMSKAQNDRYESVGAFVEAFTGSRLAETRTQSPAVSSDLAEASTLSSNKLALGAASTMDSRRIATPVGTKGSDLGSAATIDSGKLKRQQAFAETIDSGKLDRQQAFAETIDSGKLDRQQAFAETIDSGKLDRQSTQLPSEPAPLSDDQVSESASPPSRGMRTLFIAIGLLGCAAAAAWIGLGGSSRDAQPAQVAANKGGNKAANTEVKSTPAADLGASIELASDAEKVDAPEGRVEPAALSGSSDRPDSASGTDEEGSKIAANDQDSEIVANDKDSKMAANDKDSKIAANDKGSKIAANDKGSKIAANDKDSEIAANDKGSNLDAAQKESSSANRTGSSQTPKPRVSSTEDADGAKAAEAKILLARAKALLQDGRNDEAIAVAMQAYRLAKLPQSFAIKVRASCRKSDHANANGAIRNIPRKHRKLRKLLKRYCQDLGITLDMKL